uniref:Uncharacterized protein n=1 Tax=viral metagenome TaxID=1070528 RepID=A0A6C0I0E0_9ZZZZ
MDLTQNKLTRSEWDSIEMPVSPEEKEILRLIVDGYNNINIKVNKTMSMLAFLKIEHTSEIESFLYNKYFSIIVNKMVQKYCNNIEKPDTQQSTILKKIRSIDQMRLDNLDANIQQNTSTIYEYVLLELCQNMCKYISKKSNKYALYLYTIIQLRKTSIQHINKYVSEFVQSLIEFANQTTRLCDIIERAYDFIERNKTLLEYADKELFSHQKELFSIFNNVERQSYPKLVLYIAPTGTGKTISPLGLAAGYRIIFVCVARHIGLALAKAAISMEKKIAFAFGCETASDIRLHYFAASKFTKNKKSGAIQKVDNSEGHLVEIMICDVKSYLTAMHYMLAFNSPTQLITYWDEPTITMDYETHDLHDIIHRNWSNNLIPNMVFSCATLPHEDELVPVWMDFRSKFEGADIHQVTSYDCRKSIPMITKDGFCAMPHTMYDTHNHLRECVRQCEMNKTLLRYFDLSQIVEFVFYLQEYISEDLQIDSYFENIEDITMNSLKIYYLELLKRLPSDIWNQIYSHFSQKRKSQFKKLPPKIAKTSSLDSKSDSKQGMPLSRTVSIGSKEIKKSKLVDSNGLLITTEDAYSLTDGPTIFLCEEVSKIGNFYIQQTKIPTELFQIILKKIDNNNKLSEKISKLESLIEDMENKISNSGDKDSTKDMEKNPEMFKLYQEIDGLRRQVKYVAMDAEYVPNTKPHQKKWAPLSTEYSAELSNKLGEDECYLNAYVPRIDENTTREIMSLEIENYLKVMLLLGIGLFMEGVNPRYLEMMKTLATDQNLFMIIASTDYIYGTNYNFCHGFLGKDLQNMTREKTLQCMGRIGRGNIQQTYTIRFRDDEMIYGLFKVPEINREAINMCKLFTSD